MTMYGFNAFLRIAPETGAYADSAFLGTPIDTRLNSSSLVMDQEKNRKTNLSVPASGMLASMYDGFLNGGGTVDIPIQYDNSGLLIYMALGTVGTTAVGSDYRHDYVPAFNLQSCNIKFQRGSNLTNSMEEFKGCMVSSMSITCEAGGEMSASFDIIAQNAAARLGNITSSFPTGDSILHFESGNLVLGGTLAPSSLELRSFELTLDNKLERKNVLGSKSTSQPVISDVREVTMSITADLDDNSIYDDMLNDKSGTVSIKFTRSAATDHYFQVTLDNAIIEGYSDAVTSFGRVERTFTVRGLTGTSDDGLKISIRNDNSSGYA
jgi:hypothetical protein